MMIYRSLVVGLLAAIALLLAEQGAAAGRAARLAAEPPRAALRDHRDPSLGDAPHTIVVVSHSGAGDDPLLVLGLGDDDRPIAIDDLPIEGPWPDAVLARWQHATPGTYFELWVSAPSGMRRVLVLVTS